MNPGAATLLSKWQAFLVRLPALGGAETLHLVGYAESCREGRVSSPVEAFDAATATARTRSGRAYVLAGPAGRNLDAEYVWHRWLRLNSVKEGDAKEVTEDLMRQMQGVAR